MISPHVLSVTYPCQRGKNKSIHLWCPWLICAIEGVIFYFKKNKIRKHDQFWLLAGLLVTVAFTTT